MALFDRVVTVHIGIPGLSGEGIEFKNLKMEFNVRKNEEVDPRNSCTLIIYNLNKDSRNKIKQENNVLHLYAGYRDDTEEELVFTGDITAVNVSIERPNVITTIEAADGEKALQEAKIAISYGEGVSSDQIIQKALDAIGLPLRSKLELVEKIKKKFSNGFSFMGQAKKLMDLITQDVDVTYSIQNGEVKLFSKNSIDLSHAFILSSQTGMVGSPQRIKIKSTKKEKVKDRDGWKTTSLLLPTLEPGSPLVINSKEIQRGQFRIVNCEHVGDSYEGTFQTTCEVVDL